MGRGGPMDNVPRQSTKSAITATSRSQLTGQSTILINLDVYLHRANIGHDISPTDDNLIVLFRRNSKEVASKPAHWGTDHCAVWKQHMEIQTSLLRHQKPQIGSEFLKKEYEIVLVALPSHSAVALFSIDFATLVQTNTYAQDRRQSFHLSPLKCRDLAASLDFEITWELVRSSTTSSAKIGATVMGMPPPASNRNSQVPKTPSIRSREVNKSRRTPNDSIPVSTRRTTTTSVSSGGSSERDFVDELSNSNCNNCRSAKRKLDRKEVQVLQLESFLKESQKRIDTLVAENEELLIREKAETRNAAHHRALSLRLLQELETTVHLCTNQMQDKETLVPQVTLIEKVKQFHAEIDPLTETNSLNSPSPPSTFDFRAETEAALLRNQRLQEQLEFLGRSMDYDSEVSGESNRPNRAITDVSVTSVSSAPSESVQLDAKERAVALTMTQQLNNLERENFKLRAELEGALANAASALKNRSSTLPSGLTSGLSLTAEVSETTSSSSREDMEEPESEDAALLTQIREQHEFEAGRSAALESDLEDAKREIATLKEQLEVAQNATVSKKSAEKDPTPPSGYLDKIYADVGKAKLVLEDRVKELEKRVEEAKLETSRVRTELETTIDTRTLELETLSKELLSIKEQLDEAQTANSKLENELQTVRLALQKAHENVAKLETLKVKTVKPPALSSSLTDAEELSDVQKQLKLAKQEVMQLRFRSNQLESLHERLDETLKEKRTLEVKLTALEGQLFDERNRTIPTEERSFTAPSLDAKSVAMLGDLQRELDQKTTALMLAERKLETLSNDGRITESTNWDDVLDKVKRLEHELRRLSERNDEQAKRLEQLGTRVAVAVRERDELEAIVDEMVTEMALLGGKERENVVRDEMEDEEKPMPEVSGSKVAALMKNFSA